MNPQQYKYGCGISPYYKKITFFGRFIQVKLNGFKKSVNKYNVHLNSSPIKKQNENSRK